MLNQENAAARGIRTFLQALIGFITGLLIVIWGVPGVPDAVWNYFTQNIGTIIAVFGIPSGLAGLTSYIWSRGRGIN
jgi:uncharacterized membrane protein YfcA